MTSAANVEKGQELVLLARNDGDTAWEIIGGAKSRGITFDNPVEDTTNSATQGESTESEWTGYSTATINLSGQADKRNNVLDATTGFNIVGSKRMTELATTGLRCGKFRLLNVSTNGYVEGEFNITSYGKSGDTAALVTFDSTLQNRGVVSVVGDF